MSTLTITLTGTCADTGGGGNHLFFVSTGAISMAVTMLLDELQNPITEQEAIAYVKATAKMAKIGRTLQQTKTLLQAGVTVTV